MCSSSKTIDDGIASIMLALNIADISLWNSGVCLSVFSPGSSH